MKACSHRSTNCRRNFFHELRNFSEPSANHNTQHFQPCRAPHPHRHHRQRSARAKMTRRIRYRRKNLLPARPKPIPRWSRKLMPNRSAIAAVASVPRSPSRHYCVSRRLMYNVAKSCSAKFAWNCPTMADCFSAPTDTCSVRIACIESSRFDFESGIALTDRYPNRNINIDN